MRVTGHNGWQARSKVFVSSDTEAVMTESLPPSAAAPIARKGASLFPLLVQAAVCICAGLALDAARVFHAHSNLQNAADAAARAAGQALGSGERDDGEIRRLAESHFRANVGDERLFGSVGALSVVADRDVGRVAIGADVYLPMTLTRFVGFDDVEIPVAAETRFAQP